MDDMLTNEGEIKQLDNPNYDEYDEVFKLEYNKENLKNMVLELQIRINKAINHLVDCCYDKEYYPEELIPIDDLWGDDLEILLKILKGEK